MKRLSVYHARCILYNTPDGLGCRTQTAIHSDTAPHLGAGARGPLIPVRLMAEALDAKVSWDGQRKAVMIVTKAAQPATRRP